MNPLSAYDLLYKDITDETREKIHFELSRILDDELSRILDESAIVDHVWEKILKSSPNELGEWKLRELIKSGIEKCPELFEAEALKQLKDENEQLKRVIEMYSQSRF